MQNNQIKNENNELKDYTIKSLPDNLSVLDPDGTIIYVNNLWKKFAYDNGIDPNLCSEGTNYLDVCDNAEGYNSDEAPVAAKGIRDVINGNKKSFELEYPCHAPRKKRWYLMKVIPLKNEYPTSVVVYHLNITERKLSEIELQKKHEQISKQNQIRKILTSTIPIFLKDSPKEKRKVVIKQMLDMIENSMFHQGYSSRDIPQEYKGLKFEYEGLNSNNVGYISCEVMNQLGGDFSIESSEKDEISFAVKGVGCPWGVEQAKINPILCNLTKGIISRFVTKSNKNAKVNTLKTLGNGDDCCYFVVSRSTNND
jgi:hypothetical protein